MSLLIAGDLVPYNNDIELFKLGNIESLLNEELFNIWEKAEHKIFNLEAPIIDIYNPISKCGPNLKIDENCINGISKLNPSIICLANNHILDHGVQGLNNTIKILNEYKFKYIGVGGNIKNQKKYETIYVDNKRVTIYNTCEIEFSVSTDEKAGAFGYDEGEIIKDLIEIKQKSDYIIVIYHGGKEHYRYPSPLLQKRCRLLTDFGANLVICQHSHCIGCMEEYNDNTIVYGQGNFIFNKNNNEYWNSSLILNVSFNNKMVVEYIPIIRLDKGIKIPEKQEYNKILADFYKRSKEIKNALFIKNAYNKFSDEMFNYYLRSLQGSNVIFRLLFKITNNKVLRFFYNKKDLLRIRNFIDCEAHRELFVNGLKRIEGDE